MIIIAAIGAIVNRIRGGWATDIAHARGWLDKSKKIPFVKPFNALVWATTWCFYLGFTWYAFLILFLSMWAGGAIGWGGYIESMINKKINHDRDDLLLLDKWFRGNDEAVLSGWAATSLRGAIWSTSLYLGFLSLTFLSYYLPPSFHYIPLVGLLMGSVYLISMKICEWISDDYYKLTVILSNINILNFPLMTKPVRLKRGNGWQLGEVLFGATLWGIPAITILS